MISICYIYNTIDDDAIIIVIPDNLPMDLIIKRLTASYQQKMNQIGRDKILVNILEKNIERMDVCYIKDKWERILNPLHSFKSFTLQGNVRWTYKIIFDKRHCILENTDTKTKFKLWKHKKYLTLTLEDVFEIDSIEPDHILGKVKSIKNDKVAPMSLHYMRVPAFLLLS